MAAAVVASGTMATSTLPITMTVAKCSLDFQTAFVRAVLCNCGCRVLPVHLGWMGRGGRCQLLIPLRAMTDVAVVCAHV